MDDKKRRQILAERMVAREIPSQIPIHTLAASYKRMLVHCSTSQGIWACSTSGARVAAKMWYRTVWNRDGSLNAAHIPVVELFCRGCDKPPVAVAESAVYADEITTLSM